MRKYINLHGIIYNFVLFSEEKKPLPRKNFQEICEKNFLWEKFVRKQHNILCNFYVIHVFTHFDICQDRHDAPDKHEL